ncbi:AAA family ATPase, partial [Candidatus Hydrogenedentota bacterium]
LLDEIEKAHTDVFNVLLQVLDDGRLTDGQGRTVDFKNTVLIMTSNVGSQWLHEVTGEEEIRERVVESLKGTFRPEFLNRIDETVIFHTLGREQIRAIVDIQLQRLDDRLEDRKIRLTLSDEARGVLAEEGYDPVYGARPLQRLIQNKVLNPLAIRILEGEFHDGQEVNVTANGNSEFVFSTRAA